MNDLFSDSLKTLLNKVGGAIPNLLLAIALLLIGIFIANKVHKLLKMLLKKIGIDKVGEKINEIEFIQKSAFELVISDIVAVTVKYIILLMTIIAATDVLGLEILSEQITKLIDYLPKLFLSFIILVAGLLFANVIKNIVTTTCKSVGITSASIVGNAIFYFLLVNVVIMAMEQAEIDTAFISQNITIIIGGIVLAMAIGYGLASRPFASNMIASFYTNTKFQIGDHIRVGDVKGIVTNMDSTSITLKNESSETVIPLSHISDEKVEKFI